MRHLLVLSALLASSGVASAQVMVMKHKYGHPWHPFRWHHGYNAGLYGGVPVGYQNGGGAGANAAGITEILTLLSLFGPRQAPPQSPAFDSQLSRIDSSLRNLDQKLDAVNAKLDKFVAMSEELKLTRQLVQQHDEVLKKHEAVIEKISPEEIQRVAKDAAVAAAKSAVESDEFIAKLAAALSKAEEEKKKKSDDRKETPAPPEPKEKKSDKPTEKIKYPAGPVKTSPAN